MSCEIWPQAQLVWVAIKGSLISFDILRSVHVPELTQAKPVKKEEEKNKLIL